MDTYQSFAEDIFKAVNLYVDKRVGALVTEIGELRAKITALPVPQNGEPGAKGMDGKDGKDADMDAIAKHVTALVEQKFAAIPIPKDGKDGAPGERGKDGESVKGDPGEKGERGEPGINAIGERGEPGERGEKGELGKPGEKGADGINGTNGQDGQEGREGKEGERGRDAIEIDVLPMIDTERSYARGTYAYYKGGRIRALRNTDPITEGIDKAGWCIDNEGIAGIEIDQADDLRTFGIALELTSGKSIVKTFALPVILDRGVFRSGEDYAKGDCVTWNGQMFIAQRDTKQEPMSLGASDWRLSVKRGRDGKDGKDGTIGLQGIPGERGRDLTHVGPNGEKYA